MLPGGVQKGDSSTSELLNSLKVYLNNKDRLQPFIGLSSIIECVKLGTHTREAVYLCEVCVCRLNKSDMRNHIMGRLHRYNYIKAWHPHFVCEFDENSSLMDMAWPLMEMAKKIEEKEGTGSVQVVEFEEEMYHMVERLRDDIAIGLINSFSDLRWSEAESHHEQEEHKPSSPRRIVLVSQSSKKQPEKPLMAELRLFNEHEPYKAQTSEPLTQQTVCTSFKHQDCVKKCSVTQNIQSSPEPSMLSENNSSFLDDYIGPKALIGLVRVVECRREDDCTHCFLCHCCRVRSSKYDIADHLTSSSHLFNYLMETHPGQVDILTADIDDNYQRLQSLAVKVEHDEGRGEIKVLKVPEWLCSLMTGKGYHWCIKMLGLTNTNFQTKEIIVKGPRLSQNTDANFSEQCDAVQSKPTKKKKRKKMTGTVFKVTLPLTHGSLLVKRTSFSVHKQPESLLLDAEPQCQPTEYIESACENTGHMVDRCSRDSMSINRTEDLHVTAFEETSPNTQSCPNVWEQRDNVDKEKQNEEPLPIEVWTSSKYSHPYEEDYTQQWYTSPFQSEVARKDVHMTPEVGHYYHQQRLQNQYRAQNHTSDFTGSMGYHAMSGGLAPYLNAGTINMYPPHFGPSVAHSSSVPTGPTHSLQVEQTQWHTYGYTAYGAGHTGTARDL